MRSGGGNWAQECSPVLCCLAARAPGVLDVAARGTPRRRLGDSRLLAVSGPQTRLPACVLGCGSRATAKFGWRARSIREKIIGHSMRGLASCFAGSRSLVVGRRLLARRVSRGGMLALLHQPARQHGGGVFLQPGIQQLSDLFAEIGRVTQAGKLITLQGIARGRQQELPRRLSFVIQGDLQGKRLYSKRLVSTINSTYVRTYCGKVYKSRAADYAQKRFPRLGMEPL